ncbi:MAG TPA: cell wall-active antibiotics response protein LiaF [Paenibacillaceae bacterium]
MVLSRNAILFAAAALYLALGFTAGFITANAALVLLLGIELFRRGRSQWGIVLMAGGALVILIRHFVLFFALMVLAAVVILFEARRSPLGRLPGRHGFHLAMRREEESWVLKPFSSWHLIGDVRLDLTRAVPEEPETVIALQGLLGDVHLLVPEDWGLWVEASVPVGRIKWQHAPDDAGVNRLAWRTPDYENKRFRLRLKVFYLVGDVKITPG